MSHLNSSAPFPCQGSTFRLHHISGKESEQSLPNALERGLVLGELGTPPLGRRCLQCASSSVMALFASGGQGRLNHRLDIPVRADRRHFDARQYDAECGSFACHQARMQQSEHQSDVAEYKATKKPCCFVMPFAVIDIEGEHPEDRCQECNHLGLHRPTHFLTEGEH